MSRCKGWQNLLFWNGRKGCLAMLKYRCILYLLLSSFGILENVSITNAAAWKKAKCYKRFWASCRIRDEKFPHKFVGGMKWMGTVVRWRGEWFKFDSGDEQSGKWRASIHWAIWVEVELKARRLRAGSRVESALETGVRSKEEGNRGCTGWRVWRNLKWRITLKRNGEA